MSQVESAGLKIRVVMLVTNDVVQDSRVKKEAHALLREGFEVLIAGVASSSVSPGHKVIEGLQIVHFDLKKTRKKPERKDSVLWEKVRAVARIMALPFTLMVIGARRIVWAPIWARLVRTRGGDRFNRFLFSRLFSHAARAEIISWQPSVVHCHDFDTLLLGRKIAKDTKAKLVYDSHELWSGRNVPHPNSLLNRIFRRVELRQEEQALRHTDLVVTVSEGIRAHLMKLGAESGSVVVVKNIPDIPVDSSFPAGPQSVEEGAIYYSGRITTGRLLEQLVDAVALLPGMSINLLGYGPADYIGTLREYAAENNVCLAVHPPVASSEVAARLRSAEVVFVGVEPLVESYRLSLPNKFFEAALSGRPVVVPQLPEILRESHSLRGFHLMEDFSSEGISKALVAATGSSFDMALAMEERAAQFNWSREAGVLVAGYRRILLDSVEEE